MVGVVIVFLVGSATDDGIIPAVTLEGDPAGKAGLGIVRKVSFSSGTDETFNPMKRAEEVEGVREPSGLVAVAATPRNDRRRFIVGVVVVVSII